MVRTVLGHGPEDVTDLYIDVSLEVQLQAVNRAALLVDGMAGENVVSLARRGLVLAGA